MAFAFKGVGGSGTTTTANQATLALTTITTAGAIGDLAVLLLAVDNSATTDQDENAVTSVTSSGNIWQKAGEYTNSRGSAQAGAVCSIWFCNLVATIPTSTVITINYSNPSSRDASAVTLAYFTKAAGQDAALEGTPATATANAAASPGSMNGPTCSTTPSILRIRAVASEGNTATAMTKTAAFDGIFTTANITGGSAAAGMGIRGEYDISTGNATLTSNPTANAGTVDHVSVYVAFKEVAAGAGSASGSATASAVGIATAASAGSASGTATASAVGSAITATTPEIYPAFAAQALNDQVTFNFGATAYAGSAPVGFQNWDYEFPVVDLDFASSSYSEALAGVLSVTNSGGYVTNTDGSLYNYPSNSLRIGGSRLHTNLQTQSQYGGAVWSTWQSTLTPNATIAPDGTTTAAAFVENTATNTHEFWTGTTIAKAAGAVQYTQSVYFKAIPGTTNRVYEINIYDGVGYALAGFDLTTGAVVYTGNPGFTAASATSTALGDGWYRGTLTATSTATGTIIGFDNFLVQVSAGPTYAGNYLGNGTSGVYVWGAQIEQGATVGSYIPTTTAAVTAPDFIGVGTGLLIEEARTNILLQSQAFDTWADATGTTVTANSVAAPDGTTTADSIVETATTNIHVRGQGFYSVAANAPVTCSIYVKPGLRTFFRLQVFTTGYSSWAVADFNLSAGAIDAAIPPFVNGTGSAVSATIEALADGWYRCTLSAILSTSATTIAAYPGFGSASGVYNYAGSTASAAGMLWGAQIELGAFATSYIPTTSASVTRNEDIVNLAGNALTCIKAPAASFVVETKSGPTSVNMGLLGADAGGGLFYVLGASGSLTQYTGSVNAVSIAAANWNGKYGLAWGADPNISLAANGNSANDTDGDAVWFATPTTATLGGWGTGAYNVNRYIPRVRFWDTRISDADLKAYTALFTISASVGTATATASATGVAASTGSVGTATATASATAVGVGLKIATGSATGTASAAAVGTGINASVGSATGTASASAVGTGRFAAVGSAQGTASAIATGAATFNAAGTAQGIATATAAGTGIKSAVGSAQGTASAVATGAATFAAAGSATGTATATGASNVILTTAGSATGTASATAAGLAIIASVGSASGIATATGTGAATVARAGSATGTAAAVATGASVAASVGSATGTASANAFADSGVAIGSASATASAIATGRAIFSAAGSAIGTAAASAPGNAIFNGVGSATGTATAIATGKSTAASVGSATATATAIATGKATFAATGSATGTAAATAVGTGIIPSVGSATATGSAIATGRSTINAIGSATSTATAIAVGTGIKPAAGSATGTASATATGRAIFAATGSAIATASANAISLIGVAIGSATATASANAVGVALFKAIGSAQGTATATAASGTSNAAVGSAAASATATAVGSAIFNAVGSATATASATGVSVPAGTATGTALASASAVAVGASTAASIGSAACSVTALGIGATFQTGTETICVHYEDRAMSALYEYRILMPPAEDRSMEVPGEEVTMGVSPRRRVC